MKAWLIIFALCLPAAAQNSLNEASSVSPTNDTSVNTANETRSVVIVSRSPGVDCTGTRDVIAALNRLFDARLGGNINGKHVIIPSLCQLRADHQVIVFGQSNFVMDGEGRPGEVSLAAMVQSALCYRSGGPDMLKLRV